MTTPLMRGLAKTDPFPQVEIMKGPSHLTFALACATFIQPLPLPASEPLLESRSGVGVDEKDGTGGQREMEQQQQANPDAREVIREKGGEETDALSFSADSAIPQPAAGPRLEEIIKPEHRTALLGAERKIAQYARSFEKDADQTTAATAREMLALLELPRAKAPEPQSLLGKWKVRSFQANERGVRAYPFFVSEFHTEGPIGVAFRKDTGSQRRIGLIGKGENGHTLFVGGRYHSHEIPAGYSALQDESVKIDPKRDSVGCVLQIDANHLLIIFAPTHYGSEVYEMKRAIK